MLHLRRHQGTPRIAIVSDTMVQSGGAERVVESLAEVFPNAPIFAILYDPKRGPRAIDKRVTESWLKYIPGARRFAKPLIPFYPSAIESFDLRGFDVIISSHHTLAKGILRNAEQTHICYCHTPMRSLWERPHEEVTRAPFFLRPLVATLLHGLRGWDFNAAARVDVFVANSETTAVRIHKHYHRDSFVLHPPIDTHRFTPGGPVEDFYLVASRNVPYKRIDLAISACELLRRRLIVVGDETDRLAKPSPYVTFLGKVSDEKLISLMRSARALLFPQHEDFGMTVLEMNACGRPVIGYGKGGALDTIVDGKTGILFHDQSAYSLADAIVRFERQAWDATAIRRHAERFSKNRFASALHQIVLSASAKQQPAEDREARLSAAGS